MAIKTIVLKRTFKYGSINLPDPGSNLSIEQVLDTYAAAYPELITAVVEGPVEKGGVLVYEFRKAVGTKG
ncbi:PRTRC system protein C [Chromobacterium haemolyticum]|uniref:PRTRC system protein C n=1 Tax=Chromobacterium fluminis TaxID=3044269 RepID=A0ABX0L4A0_9NEIS|nr:PRTRC system protein C [Chromobacterium haemolyticum]NHR04467.1 PRTRC system protein C [Chromobacterium haemolyticum]